MIKLPFCSYPKAADKHMHGLQSLPGILPLVSMEAVKPYRSLHYRAVGIKHFSEAKRKALIRMMAASFVLNEPMNRHLKASLVPPDIINDSKFLQLYGEDKFGEWERENIFYWIISLLVFYRNKEGLKTNSNFAKKLSLAIINDNNEIIGGALNIRLYPFDRQTSPAHNDPFFQAVTAYSAPVVNMLMNQEHESISALSNAYGDFKTALDDGKVGELFMLARSPLLPTEDSFELVAVSIERFMSLGYKFVVTAAANQYTGAAFEALGGVRVHFAPYRATPQMTASVNGLADETSSEDGYLSAKDSGCIFYVIKLND